jgi:hypothetical protein
VGVLEVERKGVEPSTFALRTRRPTVASDGRQGVTSATSPACTAACTSGGENEHGTSEKGAGESTDQKVLDDGAGDHRAASDNTLATLAAALVNLSTADRAKLAAMLLQGND